MDGREKKEQPAWPTGSKAWGGLKAFLGAERGFLGALTASVRRRILTGVLIMVPIVISFLPVYFIYPWFDRFAQRYLGRIGDVPGLGFIAAVLVIVSVLYIIGLLSATFVVRWLMTLGEKVLTQIPLINFFYRTTKQVVDLVAPASSPAFRRPVLIEYPRKGIFVLGFITGEGKYPDPIRDQIHIFLPTTPNPTSGVLLLLSPDQVYETGLSIDEATRFIISGGILEMPPLDLKPYKIGAPPEPHELEAAN